MSSPEANRTRIVSRLKRDGWISEGGTNHEKFTREGAVQPIMVPRHRVVTAGVARAIAKQAGWSEVR